MKIDNRAQTIVLDAGGGCLTLFGLGFASMGSFFIYLLLTGGELTVNGRPGEPSDVWFPAIFVLIGAAIGLTRYRRTVDLRAGTLTKRLSCVVPLRHSQSSIASPDQVTLSREVRRSQKSSTTVYPVRLRAGSDTIDLTAGQSVERARRDAEAVAALAEVPLHDTSAGETYVRGHDELDRSVVETDTQEEAVARPRDSAVQTENRVRELVIRLPIAPAPLLFRIAGLLFISPIFLGFWWFAWRPGMDDLGDSGIGGWLFAHAPLLMLAIPALSVVISTFRSGFLGQTVLVDREGLKVNSLLRSTRIATRELEELRVVNGTGRQGVLARTDRGSVTLGPGLSNADRHYLRSLILEKLKQES